MIRTITPIFSILIALAIFFFFAQPKFAEIKKIQAETAQYENAAVKATELNEELSRKLTEKRSYPAEALEKLDALVPPSIDEVKVLSDLNDLAEKHMMLFGNVTIDTNVGENGAKDASTAAPTQTITYDSLTRKNVNFSLIGTYDQFKAFMNDVEQSLVMFETTNINFMTGESELQQYEVTGQIFSLPPIE